MNTVTSPVQIVFALLADTNRWSIDGEATIAGRKADIVSGDATALSSTQDQQSERFMLWVDRETGVLLKMHRYGPDGKLDYFHEVKTIQFNVPLDAGLFDLPEDPSN